MGGIPPLRLKKAAKDSQRGSVWHCAHMRDGEQEQILPLHANNKPKTAGEKPPLTTQSCSHLRPGRGGESRNLSCSLPPKTGGQGVGGQQGGGLSLGHGLELAVCSGRLMPIANCCHSQEEGGGQGIMTQVFLGWYSLQGCFLHRGSPCPTLTPGPHSAPSPHGGDRSSAVPCTSYQLHAFVCVGMTQAPP